MAVTLRVIDINVDYAQCQCMWTHRQAIEIFAGQVLAYLEPEYQQHYRGKGVWEELQQRVVDGLEALAP